MSPYLSTPSKGQPSNGSDEVRSRRMHPLTPSTAPSCPKGAPSAHCHSFAFSNVSSHNTGGDKLAATKTTTPVSWILMGWLAGEMILDALPAGHRLLLVGPSGAADSTSLIDQKLKYKLFPDFGRAIAYSYFSIIIFRQKFCRLPYCQWNRLNP